MTETPAATMVSKPPAPNGNASVRPHSQEQRSDEELMLEVQRGDGDAFAALFDRYHRLVLTVALRITHDASEAQEVTQNVFLEFYRRAHRFDPSKGTLKIWLLQFAYHRSINRRNYLLLRQFYDRPDLDEAEAFEARTSTQPRIPVEELKQLVRQALGKLNEPRRRVIEGVIFQGLTLREFAEQTGQSYAAVRNHYYRGLDNLRECLALQTATERTTKALGMGEVSRGKT